MTTENSNIPENREGTAYSLIPGIPHLHCLLSHNYDDVGLFDQLWSVIADLLSHSSTAFVLSCVAFFLKKESFFPYSFLPWKGTVLTMVLNYSIPTTHNIDKPPMITIYGATSSLLYDLMTQPYFHINEWTDIFVFVLFMWYKSKLFINWAHCLFYTCVCCFTSTQLLTQPYIINKKALPLAWLCERCQSWDAPPKANGSNTTCCHLLQNTSVHPRIHSHNILGHDDGTALEVVSRPPARHWQKAECRTILLLQRL